MVRVVATPSIFRQISWQPVPREPREREYVPRPPRVRKTHSDPPVRVLPPADKPTAHDGGVDLV